MNIRGAEKLRQAFARLQRKKTYVREAGNRGFESGLHETVAANDKHEVRTA